jgi:hypothetical protein
VLEQLRHQVDPGHAPAGPRGRKGGVARAAGDVEHAHSRLDPGPGGDSSPTSAIRSDSVA